MIETYKPIGDYSQARLEKTSATADGHVTLSTQKCSCTYYYICTKVSLGVRLLNDVASYVNIKLFVFLTHLIYVGLFQYLNFLQFFFLIDLFNKLTAKPIALGTSAGSNQVTNIRLASHLSNYP